MVENNNPKKDEPSCVEGCALLVLTVLAIMIIWKVLEGGSFMEALFLLAFIYEVFTLSLGCVILFILLFVLSSCAPSFAASIGGILFLFLILGGIFLILDKDSCKSSQEEKDDWGYNDYRDNKDEDVYEDDNRKIGFWELWDFIFGSSDDDDDYYDDYYDDDDYY